jgi:hypothetical protein
MTNVLQSDKEVFSSEKVLIPCSFYKNVDVFEEFGVRRSFVPCGIPDFLVFFSNSPRGFFNILNMGVEVLVFCKVFLYTPEFCLLFRSL